MAIKGIVRHLVSPGIKNIAGRFHLLVLPLVLLTCATVPKTPAPGWVSDLQSVFPQDDYLAEKGLGKTQAEAELAGSRAISRYISTFVASQLTEEVLLMGSGPTESIITDITVIESDLELPAIRYAAAWYNSPEKQWETVAYINREEAWTTAYEAELRNTQETFFNIYTKAEGENDPVRRFAIYRGAQNYYARNLARQRVIASRIHPARAQVFFEDLAMALSELPRKLDDARLGAVIFIDANNDDQNRIGQVFERALSDENFRLSRNRAEAAALLSININLGETAHENSFSFNPVILASLTSASGILFSYNSPAMQTISTMTRDAGLRRTWNSLAAEVEKTFPIEFRQRLASFVSD